MHMPLPDTQDLVLIGGGHTHALVLRMWGMNPLPGARITVINPGPTAPYSGMLPGHLAGHYDRAALDIDLVKLARFAGARVVQGSVTGIDVQAKQVHVPGRPPIAYDYASIDIGIHSRMPALPGFAEHAVPVKPLAPFASAWESYRTGTGPASVAVIGGGVAGCEIALAFAHALGQRGRAARITVLERDDALTALRKPAADRLRAAMQDFGIDLIERAQVARIEDGRVVLQDQTIEAGFICGAAGTRPHPWVADLALAQTDGFIDVDKHLLTSDPAIFAVGDCAHMTDQPRPKAGVYAVRQAPILLHNLRAALSGKGAMKPYKAQDDYLKLVSLGGKRALVDRYGLALSGAWLWRWKNHIDQKFMDQFRHLPQMATPALPADHAAGMIEAIGPKPMCGGCGSKLGQGALARAISCVTATRDDVVTLPGDDAAYLKTGGARQVMTTDHLRAMVLDPVVMTRITALHALGDIWAMGADPQAATVNLILPPQSRALAERQMAEIMATAQEVMAEAGAQIVGGHSTLGAELTIGFTLTGLCAREPISLSGAKPGDALILTKPIGSGVVMAAEMAGRARGEWVEAALSRMCQSQGPAARLLAEAHAMTDVTGFGLLGHLRNICRASGVGARLDLSEIRLMPGALTLSEQGIRSTIYPDNRAALPDLPKTPVNDLLFDPQTAGGLLAAVPGDAQAVLATLTASGFDAAIVGQITANPDQIDVV